MHMVRQQGGSTGTGAGNVVNLEQQNQAIPKNSNVTGKMRKMLKLNEVTNTQLNQNSNLRNSHICVHIIACLQCYDAVGWVAGRASRL